MAAAGQTRTLRACDRGSWRPPPTCLPASPLPAAHAPAHCSIETAPISQQRPYISPHNVVCYFVHASMALPAQNKLWRRHQCDPARAGTENVVECTLLQGRRMLPMSQVPNTSCRSLRRQIQVPVALAALAAHARACWKRAHSVEPRHVLLSIQPEACTSLHAWDHVRWTAPPPSALSWPCRNTRTGARKGRCQRLHKSELCKLKALTQGRQGSPIQREARAGPHPTKLPLLDSAPES